MIKRVLLSSFTAMICMTSLYASEKEVLSPDGRLKVVVSDEGGIPSYQVFYDGVTFIEKSPLGMKTTIGDFTSSLSLGSEIKEISIRKNYRLPNIKKSKVEYAAESVVVPFTKEGRTAFDVEFPVSNNDVAFRYETPYTVDDTMGKNGWGEGYTFPCLFKNSDKGWILISETGVNSYYCGSRLMGHEDGVYTIGFPQEGEFNGNGTISPGIALPGKTPWRTITLGSTLAPIVETTVPFDVVEPLYEPSKDYTAEYGCGTWSWIIAGDASMNMDDQKRYVDFCAAMGYRTVLVDALWDTQVGYDKIEELAAYAKQKNVGLYLWYNSNGYWNDAPQGPRGKMSNIIERRKEMKWMQRIGIKGIKVDFIGSDKQVTMQLYEDILADANDYGLLVIFHGCTIPRGWERMYPNYAASEAVLASENMNFSQGSCDAEAFNACIHPFVRNTIGSMDFGGSTLNKYYNAKNEPGGRLRVTSDVFALATAVLFQSPVQHFALAPNNLTDAPVWVVDFMKKVPTTWDEVKFIDGYPGKYIVMARKHAGKWYVAGINAQDETIKLKIDVSTLFAAGEIVNLYEDNDKLAGSVKEQLISKKQTLNLSIPKNGGVVITRK